MSTFTKLNYHIVFSTKHRQPIIQNTFEHRLYEYIGGIIRALNGHLIEIGGIEDHIHILAGLSPTKSVSDCTREIKANASKWCNELSKTTHRFEWQKGYGAFTVSYSNLDAVRHYIQNQREHHQTKSFKDEYIAILKRHDITFDTKYLFDDEFHG